MSSVTVPEGREEKMSENRFESAKNIAEFVCFFVVIFGLLWMAKEHSEDVNFHSVIGVDRMKGDAQVAQVPIITVKVGKIRQAAIASWNAYQDLARQADAIVITDESSPDIANSKSVLIEATEHARLVHQQDWYHLRYACRLLRDYPAATRTACPTN